MPEYDITVFVGRQEPPHRVHMDLMNHCNSISNHTLVLFGSADCARTIKNPFHEEEREVMLRMHYEKEFRDEKMFTDAIVDFPYNNSLWISQVQTAVDKLASKLYKNKEPKIALVANWKDMNSFWIDFFPHWGHVKTYLDKDLLSSTSIREQYFEGNKDYEKNISPAIYEYMEQFKKTEPYDHLVNEYIWNRDYINSWNGAPFKPAFYTCDSVVIKSGHILLVERKGRPGKGLWALPGGYVEPYETAFVGSLRELKQETRIIVPKEEIANSLVDSKVFDHPERSLRGRVVTWAFNYNLGGGELPKVKGSDDAKKAFWIPINQVSKYSRMFFEDHKHIIEYFIYKQ